MRDTGPGSISASCRADLRGLPATPRSRGAGHRRRAVDRQARGGATRWRHRSRDGARPAHGRGAAASRDAAATRSGPVIGGTGSDRLGASRPHLIQILLAEDSPADVELTRQAFYWRRRSPTRSSSATARRRSSSFAAAGSTPRPRGRIFILLDLNMPKKDGREVLEEIKNDPDLRRIPVVVLTTSAAEDDIVSAYDHHVDFLHPQADSARRLHPHDARDQQLLARIRLFPPRSGGLEGFQAASSAPRSRPDAGATGSSRCGAAASAGRRALARRRPACSGFPWMS